MKITVEMIVFNAATVNPIGMLRAAVMQFYPYVDEILIAEGATFAQKHRFDGDASQYTRDGKSTDNTLQTIYALPDPQHKIRVYEARGFWDGKTSMFNELQRHATGDYVWQVDSDEFYLDGHIQSIIEILKGMRPDAVHFFANHFVGDWGHIISRETDHRWANDIPWRRIFRNAPGSHWDSHEPPEMITDGKFCNAGKVITREEMDAFGIRLFHYSLVCREQALFKDAFYRQLDRYTKAWDNHQRDPHGTWWINQTKSEPFFGRHPSCIKSIVNL